MDGSEPPATDGTEPNGMIDIITALQQGGEYAPFGTNNEPCGTMVQNVEEPPVAITPEQDILHGLSLNVTEALMNGEAFDPLGMNSAESSSGNEHTDANDTEDDVAETIEPVEDSFFDTASVGTDPNSTLF